MGEGTDLVVDAHHEGFTLPSAHLADGQGIHSIEAECHGPSSSEGVAANVLGVVANFW